MGGGALQDEVSSQTIQSSKGSGSTLRTDAAVNTFLILFLILRRHMPTILVCEMSFIHRARTLLLPKQQVVGKVNRLLILLCAILVPSEIVLPFSKRTRTLRSQDLSGEVWNSNHYKSRSLRCQSSLPTQQCHSSGKAKCPRSKTEPPGRQSTDRPRQQAWYFAVGQRCSSLEKCNQRKQKKMTMQEWRCLKWPPTCRTAAGL